jgi:hypothetical protein
MKIGELDYQTLLRTLDLSVQEQLELGSFGLYLPYDVEVISNE